MKALYVITVELDEDSVYFTEMTPAESSRMRAALERTGLPFSIQKIRQAPGYNDYEGLMGTFRDWRS